MGQLVSLKKSSFVFVLLLLNLYVVRFRCGFFVRAHEDDDVNMKTNDLLTYKCILDNFRLYDTIRFN